MSDASMENTANTAKPKEDVGSVLFFRLKPTYRVTEFMTLAFYPMFFGFVGGTTSFGYGGPILFAVLGLGMAVVAITLRRWGARWANSWMEKRVLKATTGDYAEGEGVTPHNNFILASDIFYMSMEIFVICGVSSITLLLSYGNSYDTFMSYYNEMKIYIDLLHSYYSRLDYEINTHIGTYYENRIYFIKFESLIIAIASLYAVFVMSIRLVIGWKKYWIYLSRVYFEVEFKKESTKIPAILIFLMITSIAIYGVFYNGANYYLVAGDIPQGPSYLYASITKLILMVGGLWMSVSIHIVLLFSYIISVVFCLMGRSQQGRA